MNTIQSTATLSAVSVTTSFTDLIVGAQLPLNTGTFNQAGVGATGSCNILLALSAPSSALVTIEASTVEDGVTYVYSTETTNQLTGGTNVAIPVSLVLSNKITFRIKANVAFTITSGTVLFQ